MKQTIKLLLPLFLLWSTSLWACSDKSESECTGNCTWRAAASNSDTGMCITTDQNNEYLARLRECQASGKSIDCERQRALDQVYEDGRNKNRTTGMENTLNGSADDKFGRRVFNPAIFAQMAMVLTAGAMVGATPPAPGDAHKYTKPSALLIIGGSLISMGGEVAARIAYRTKLKKLVEDYHHQVKNNHNEQVEEGTDNTFAQQKDEQVKAFDFLADQERARRTAASTRAIAYSTASGMYVTAMILASIEQVVALGASFTPLNKNLDDQNFFLNQELKKYVGINIDWEDLKQEEILEIISRVSSFFLPAAYAQETPGINLEDNGLNLDRSGEILDSDGSVKASAKDTIGVEIAAMMTSFGPLLTGGLLLSLNEGYSEAMNTAVGRVVVSTTMSAWSITVAGLSLDAWVKSNKRINDIKSIQRTFSDLVDTANPNSCTSRTDPTNIICYCYTEDGSRDSSKMNSQVCANAFSGSQLPPQSTWDMMAQVEVENNNPCLSQNGVVSSGSECECRRSGRANNQCRRLSFNGQVPGGASQAFNSSIGSANDFMSGNLGAAQMGGVSQRTNAMRAALKKMEKDPKLGKILKDGMAKGEKLQQQVMDSLNRAFASAPAGALAGLSPFGDSGALATADDLKKEVAESLKKADLEFKAGPAPASIGKVDDFNFDLGGNNAGGSEIDLTETMNQDFEYDDISGNKSGNIFQILSLRYQKSAFQKLFEE